MYQIKPINKNRNFFNSRLFKTLIIFFLVFAFVFVVSSSSFMSSVISQSLFPLFKVGGYFYKTVNFIPKFLSDKNMLIEENKNLLDNLENNRILAVDYEAIKHENLELRETLKLRVSENLIVSRIIARPPQIPLDSLFIDKGAKDFINDKNLVLAGERALIGKIVKVTKNNATVALNSFPDIVSFGYLERTNEPIEITGIGGGSMQTKVPIDFDIILHDYVITSNSFTYMLARVEVIEENQSAGSKNILMSLPLDISKIKTVFIESNYLE